MKRILTFLAAMIFSTNLGACGPLDTFVDAIIHGKPIVATSTNLDFLNQLRDDTAQQRKLAEQVVAESSIYIDYAQATSYKIVFMSQQDSLRISRTLFLIPTHGKINIVMEYTYKNKRVETNLTNARTTPEHYEYYYSNEEFTQDGELIAGLMDQQMFIPSIVSYQFSYNLARPGNLEQFKEILRSKNVRVTRAGELLTACGKTCYSIGREDAFLYAYEMEDP